MDPTTSGAHDPFAGSHVYVDPSQYNSYENLNFFQTDADAVYNDNDWTLGDTQPVARAQQPSQTWSHNGDQVPVSIQHAQPQQSQHQQQQNPYLSQPAQYRNSQSKSPTPFTTNGFGAYGAQQPYSYNEQKFDPASAYKHQHLNANNVPQQHFDPSLTQINPNTAQNYHAGGHYGSQATATPTTFAPQALENNRSQPSLKNNVYAGPPYQQGTSHTPQAATTPAPASLRNVDEEALARAVPKSVAGGIFSIINFDDLARATNTDRFGNYVNIGKDRQEWQCTRSALPTYVPRHSRKQLRELASKNAQALAKIGKKPTKVKPMISAVKPSKPAPATSRATDNLITLKDSSSEDESSSDDDSDYSDDDDAESPLPSRKPEDPKGCIEYDTIKALWRNKRRNISSDSFKQALVDFWDIVKTIRDRWKLDSTAYTEAEEKKRTGELPLLRSRVKDQRDMIEVAFRTALKHGHRGIVELLAENSSLVFVCSQFLLDRQKADDLNGSVTRAIFEILSTFTTLTEEKLEKVRLNKLLAIYQKKGDAKTQFWVKKIKANAVTASKNAAEKETAVKPSSDAPAKAADAAASSPGKASAAAAKRPEAVSGVKRAANGVSEANPAKRMAVGKPPVNGAASAVKPVAGAGAVKKPLTSAVPTNATATTSAAPRKTVAAKPTGFFSSLSSAAKKPGTSIAEKATSATGDRTAAARNPVSNAAPMAKPAFSFAETMAKLSKPKEEKPAPKPEKEVPTETTEERTKRLRKEERRKLRVRFRPDSDLVQIRLFTHDPEEELHHDASQVRDVADVGGEGRMFKQQHKLMDLDEEDDAPEEPENLVEFKEPSLVDFSVVEKDERQRNYEPYGGGVLKVTSAESDERRKYEDSNLVVFYASPDDIPANPREPANAYTGELSEPFRPFGLPDEQYVNRARERRASKINANAPSGFNIAALAGLLSKAAPQPQQQVQQQPVMAPAAASTQMPDISSILANLRQGALAAQPQQPDAYQPPPPSVQYQAPPPPAHPALPPANIDLAAILAALNGNNNANQPPAASAPNMNNYGSDYGSQPAWGMNHGSNNSHDDSEEQEIAKAKAGNPAYKTKTCRFYQEGRCQKGAACGYIHART
jgi:hypothetical protein